MKVIRRVESRQKQTSTKPLPIGGKVHVYSGRVHRGAGFEGQVDAIGWAQQQGAKYGHVALVGGGEWGGE